MACAAGTKTAQLVMSGDEHTLRDRPSWEQTKSARATPVMVLAIDGVSRDLLYTMMRRHELPNLAALVGPTAYYDESFISTLPSTTMPAWVTAMTGVPPAVHGVTGNEFWIRETETFACPAPVSFDSSAPTLAIYTDRYLDKLVEVPTVYEQMREKDPHVLIWVAMNHLFRGADKLLLAKRGVLVKAFAAVLQADKRDLFAALDEGAIDVVVDHLREQTLPDVLTVYLSGTDLYAHVAKEGPDAARVAYLREVIDPALGKLVAQLRKRGLLERMWTVVLSDHGHTAVLHDETHALAVQDSPRAILERAGFKVRPAQQDADNAGSAVLAYGGAMAYVYLADRSQCTDSCKWREPPRYKEDVLVAAEAFHKDLGDKLDMILTRKPLPYAQVDLPFEVYLGDGKTMPLDDYLREHPHPTYVAFTERMRQLAVGPHGERAGDILLLAHNGDRKRPEDRLYFALEYRSWHGSPSRDDSEIPLIVGRHHMRSDRDIVHDVLGDTPYQWKLTPLMRALSKR